jgi:hypothetical protein
LKKLKNHRVKIDSWPRRILEAARRGFDSHRCLHVSLRIPKFANKSSWI